LDFWRRAARMSQTLKVRNEVIREKAEVTQAVVERTENNTWRRYGNVLSMEGKRRPQRLLVWSPEGVDDWKRSRKEK
jgi:hypothetical protein